jgi:DNA-binding NarL/FixJ family response regulator
MQEPAARTAVLVDRHPLWIAGAERLLEKMGITVVGSTASTLDAVALVARYEPDLLMVDVSTADPAMDGLTCLRLAIARVPGLRAIVVSPDNDPDGIRAAFAAGAKAYVVTSASEDDVSAAVRQVFEAQIYVVSPFTAETTADVLPTPLIGVTSDETFDALVKPLTPGEREILVHAAEGLSNAAIARVLCVAEQTVKFHLSNIYRKLGASNRTEASRWAQLHGLLVADRDDRRLAATN